MRIIILFLSSLLLPPVLRADEPPVLDPERRFFAFDVLHRPVAEELLDEAAAAGFGLVQFRPGFRSGWTEGGFAALLAREGAAEGPIDYRILTHTHPSRLQEGLNEAAAEGFVLLPDAFFHQNRGAAPFQDPEYVALLARFPGEAKTRHYLVPGAEGLRNSVQVAVRRGYEVVAVAAGREAPVVVMEIYFRGADSAPPPGDLYLLAEAKRLGTLRKQVRDAPDRGYRVLASAVDGARYVALLRRDPGAAGIDYRVPAKKELLEEIVAAGSDGFRLLRGTLGSVPILERRPDDARRYEYRAVGRPDAEEVEAGAADPWKRESRRKKRQRLAPDPEDWLRELEARAEEGWVVRGLLAPRVALIERPLPQGADHGGGSGSP